MWGMAKATDTPLVVREAQIARKWEESQGAGESSEFIQ